MSYLTDIDAQVVLVVRAVAHREAQFVLAVEPEQVHLLDRDRPRG